jgi:hypothetical protein
MPAAAEVDSEQVRYAASSQHSTHKHSSLMSHLAAHGGAWVGRHGIVRQGLLASRALEWLGARTQIDVAAGGLQMHMTIIGNMHNTCEGLQLKVG